MKKILAALLLSASALPAQADLISAVNLDVIGAPSTVGFNFLVGSGRTQVLFAERQGVTLAAPLVTDTGIIPAGAVVDSWFAATNHGNIPVVIATDISATFGGAVLGLVYDSNAAFEPSPNFVLSNAVLGAIGTTYSLGPDCYTCGYETFQLNTDQAVNGLGFDYAGFTGSTFNAHTVEGIPGDYVRIITTTTASVPGPLAGAGFPGLMLALFWLVGLARRRLAS